MIPTSLILTGSIGIKDGLGLETVMFDFRKFQSGLIAFVGDNGIGKTTVMECLHPHLCMASRGGKLQDHFYLKKSIKDFCFNYRGTPYRSLALIDANSGKIEAYLYKGEKDIEERKPLNPDGKVSTYEQAVEDLLGSPDLFFKSIFMSQNYTPFSKLKTAERKKLFIEILGFERYAKYEAYAKSQADVVEGEILSIRTEIENLEKQIAEMDPKIAVLEQTKKELEENKVLLSSLQSDLQLYRNERANLETQKARQGEITKKLEELQIQKKKIETEIATTTERTENGRLSYARTRLAITEDIQKCESVIDKKSVIEQLIENKEKTLSEIDAKISKLNDVQETRDRLTSELGLLKNELKELSETHEKTKQKKIEERDVIKVKIDGQQSAINRGSLIQERIETLTDLRKSLQRMEEGAKTYHELVSQKTIALQEYSSRWQQWKQKCSLLEHEIGVLKGSIGSQEKLLESKQTTAQLIEEVPCNEYEGLPGRCKLLRSEIQAKSEIPKIEHSLKELRIELDVKSDLLLQKMKDEPLKSNLNELDQKLELCGYVPQIHETRRMELSKMEAENWEQQLSQIDSAYILLGEYRTSLETINNSLLDLETEFDRKKKEADTRIAEKSVQIDSLPQIEGAIELEENRDSVKAEIEKFRRNILIAETLIVEKRNALKSLDQQIAEFEQTTSGFLELSKMQLQSIDKELSDNKKLIDESLPERLKSIEEKISHSEQVIGQYENLKSTLQKKAGQYEAEIEGCKRAQISASEKKTAIADKVVVLQDWRLIQQACGKEGIPALELDASGGQISAIANDLLTKTFDTSFQIRFETIAEKKDGGQKEVFDIKVLKDGEERNIDMLSGGQKVWIEKGIFESIAIYLTQSSDKEYLTSFSDESDGALSPAKKLLYLKMLRESFRIGQRYFTILVSQDPGVWSQIQQKIIFDPERGIQYQY